MYDIYMLQIARSGFLERRSSMNLRKTMNVIVAIIAIMAMFATTVCAATTATTTVQSAVEVTYNKSDEKAHNKYPKSFQRRLLESKDDREVTRAMEESKALKANTVKVDSYGIAWKSADSEKVAKVRVKAGSIDFQWTPIFTGYTWIADLSMWSNKGLLGKEATLYFLDKEAKVIWSTTVVLPKDVKVPEVDKETGKEEIVPPCPMAPTSAPAEAVQIGVAPGENK